MFAITSSALAEPPQWTLTTADFQTRQVAIASIDGTGINASSGQVNWSDLLLLDRDLSGKAESSGKFTLYLAGGDQYRGDPAKLQGEKLDWNSPALGAMKVPLKQVVAITRAGKPSPSGDTKRTEDVVTLSNGDVVSGILSELADGSLKMQSQGNEVAIGLDTVASLVLASTSPAGATNPSASARAFRVTLSDDSVVTATAIQSKGDRLVLTLAGGERTVPFAIVAGIEQLNGPVSWLSSRTPSANVQTPLLDTARPAKMDKTVSGKPISFGERTYARGIGVAPYSRLTWSLDGAGEYKAFRTQYAMDSRGAYADVTVRIKLDDKVVHERKDFAAGEISPLVVVPIKGAKTLTLEVDFGGNYNVQDHLNWIEPALLKASAIPKPAAAVAPPTTSSAQ